MSNYQASDVEKKWQQKWADSGLFKVDLESSKKPKYYNLVMFPYPSGDKLHVGHWYNYGPADSWGRYMKIKGFEVFEPMGFDSFGLPAENYAIKTGVHPTKSIATNVEQMKKQLSGIGAMYDWDKMVTTSSPDYYKWTQWVFLELYKKGLAYKKNAAVNWCPSCQTVLANEQVDDGKCDRCKSVVSKKNLNQWFFNIRSYAEKLLDYSELDWPEKTVLMQKNWIGRSEGSEVKFKFVGRQESLDVFTTRVDTLFSGAFVVLAPEHPLVNLVTTDEQRAEVEAYTEATKSKNDIERSAEGGEKTGVFTGAYVVNPINNQEIPVWIGDFVLMHYGTGAVFGDAHDERDFIFAKKYGIKLWTTIKPADGSDDSAIKNLEVCFTEDGILYDSGKFDGLSSAEARKAITEELEAAENGRFVVNYRLRDWLISRQRYWGAPIPIVYCEKCGEVPLEESDLPVLLPENVDFEPSGDGKSPLAKNDAFKNVTCPRCGGGAEREVDTMDTFVCSSWYFLRYPSAEMSGAPFSSELANKWLPVDMYIGGPEHACMHLLYARFINMVMHDLGHINFKEPFKKLVHQGMVTKDGAKMSKSKGNVVSPDEFVSKYGSDVFRMYLMFMGPFTEGGDWNDRGITGVARFVDKFWKMICGEQEVTSEKDLVRAVNKITKKITEDIEKFQFNTAIAGLMEFVNFASKNGIDTENKKVLVKLISPMAPHLAEECWEKLGEKGSVLDGSWPTFDPALVEDDVVTIGVQVNGKVRGDITVGKDAEKEEVLAMARSHENVMKFLGDKQILKEIYVPGKIVGFVVKE